MSYVRRIYRRKLQLPRLNRTVATREFLNDDSSLPLTLLSRTKQSIEVATSASWRASLVFLHGSLPFLLVSIVFLRMSFVLLQTSLVSVVA